MALSKEEKQQILQTTKDLLVGMVSPHDPWGDHEDVKDLRDFNIKFKMLYTQVHQIVRQQYELLDQPMTAGDMSPDLLPPEFPSPGGDPDSEDGRGGLSLELADPE